MFRSRVLRYYRTGRRDMPWRRTHDPYRILVSEFMLQQTQVSRVREKYDAFCAAFPTVADLARASLRRVLTAWQGLGYNRRARHLWLCARAIVEHCNGKVPSTVPALLALPGVGRSTAGAVAAFAFNRPAVFIETNIRAAFIDFFFPHAKAVSDRELEPLVEAALDRRNPREWYYALFDYGTYVKSVVPSVGARSAHYKKQTAFAGSRRQLRGAALALLSGRENGVTTAEAARYLKRDSASVRAVLNALEREGFLVEHRGRYRIAE